MKADIWEKVIVGWVVSSMRILTFCLHPINSAALKENIPDSKHFCLIKAHVQFSNFSLCSTPTTTCSHSDAWASEGSAFIISIWTNQYFCLLRNLNSLAKYYFSDVKSKLGFNLLDFNLRSLMPLWNLKFTFLIKIRAYINHYI